jgi:hypothetical protein
LPSSFVRALFVALIAAAPGVAQAQGEITTTTLIKGGDTLTFRGRVTFPHADRYIFLARKDARLVATLTATSARLLLVVIPADADPGRPESEWTYSAAFDQRLAFEGRRAVAVLFDPRIDFAEAPRPASYRLELRME